MTLKFQLGNTYAQQVETLQQIKDSQICGIINHPAVIEAAKDCTDLQTFITLYLETNTTLAHLELPSHLIA